MSEAAIHLRTETARSTRTGVITARQIEGATSQARAQSRDIGLTDAAARGQGRFTIRCTASGARVCMFRYTRRDGRRDILKIADYDPRGVSGLTLQEAREQAGELAKTAAGGQDLRSLFAQQERERVDAESASVAEQRKAASGSLEELFRVYVTTLQGRESHNDARAIFKLHVTGPFPGLVTTKASFVRAEELRNVLARLIEAGKGRTAAKLRTYLRAAYALAMRAALDPTVPEGSSDLRSRSIRRIDCRAWLSIPRPAIAP
jgi:hypothetical protein